MVARLPAAGERRRTLVVVAHLDAAHTGWVWSPALTALNRRWGTPSHALPVAALAGIATGFRPLRRLGGALLGVTLALYAQAARSPTVPGANDNASGVAGALELARRLLEDPVEGLEVVLLFPGGEEASAVGMGAWLQTEGRALDPATTFVLGLDSIGSSGEIVTSRRDGFVTRFRDQDLDLLDAAARRAGLPPPRRVAFPNVTDAAVARHAGMRAATLLTLTDGWVENLHLPSDRPESVDWAMAERCVRLARAVAEVWAGSRVDRWASRPCLPHPRGACGRWLARWRRS